MKEITDLKFTIRKYVVGKSGYELDTTLLRRYFRQQNHYLVIFHQLFFYVHRSAVLLFTFSLSTNLLD